MKKAWKKLLISALSLALTITCALGLVACGGEESGWDKSEVNGFYGANKSFGTVIDGTNGGFVAETDKYVYFINGIGASSAVNSFGSPIKGSLVVAEKTDLTKTCIVVPKLFVASDYNAGLYIKGDYVYYGTPSTDKKSDGSVANDELVISRAKLDGSETKSYITIGGISQEYRFVEIDGKVCVLYYDSDDTALICYDTDAQTKTVIAKTDIEATAKDGETDDTIKGETLDTFKFTANGAIVYSVKVYKEAFSQDKQDAQGSSYDRDTFDYNRVYVYKNGVTTKVLDGKATANRLLDEKYTLSVVNGDYVFYTYGESVTHTGVLDTTVTHIATANKGEVNATYATADVIIVNAVGELKVLAKNSDGTKLVADVLAKTNTDVKQYISNVSTVSKLLFINGDYVYYVNSSNQLARVLLDATGKTDVELMEQRLTENTVATDWFKPEFVGDKLFYIDNSSKGLSYVSYIDVTGTVEEEKDDDGEVTLRYLEGNTVIGKITNQDSATMFENKVSDLSSSLSVIDYDRNDDDEIKLTDGKPTIEDAKAEINAVREAYNALSDSVKELVSDSSVQTLENYEYAVTLTEKMIKLYGFNKYMTTDEKDDFREEYNIVKAQLESLEDSSDYSYSTIRAMMAENLNFFYQEADEYFNPSDDE